MRLNWTTLAPVRFRSSLVHDKENRPASPLFAGRPEGNHRTTPRPFYVTVAWQTRSQKLMKKKRRPVVAPVLSPIGAHKTK
jgi:hypothetical protein